MCTCIHCLPIITSRIQHRTKLLAAIVHLEQLEHASESCVQEALDRKIMTLKKELESLVAAEFAHVKSMSCSP